MADIKHQIPLPDAPAYSTPAAPQAIYSQPEQMDVHGGSQYINATPLLELKRTAAPVDCPKCGRRAMTSTSAKTGGLTQ